MSWAESEHLGLEDVYRFILFFGCEVTGRTADNTRMTGTELRIRGVARDSSTVLRRGGSDHSM
jgi:hypothetical protein